MANEFGHELFTLNCEPEEPYIVGDDTILNGRASTFTIVA
jgi:hypothetical protein